MADAAKRAAKWEAWRREKGQGLAAAEARAAAGRAEKERMEKEVRAVTRGCSDDCSERSDDCSERSDDYSERSDDCSERTGCSESSVGSGGGGGTTAPR